MARTKIKTTMSYLEDRLKRKNGELPPLPTKKPKKPILKMSAKKRAEQKVSGDDELDVFYDDCLKKCKGKCFFSGQPTLYKHENIALRRSAVMHLLPKSKFKSIATHPENWVEASLEYHRKFDDGVLTWQLLKDSAEWPVLLEKLLTLLPLTNPDERKTKFYHNLEQLIYNK